MPASASISRCEDARQRYTAFAAALHWIVAAVLIVQFSWGWLMQQIPKQPPGLRADAFNVHKSIGLMLLALMLVRLGWRLLHPAPPLRGLPPWQRALAHATHRLLYAALIVQPLAGYLGSVFSGYPVKWFGVTLPAWGWPSVALKDFMSSVHLATSFVILFAVLLHLAGALRHAWAGDGYLGRMGFDRTRTVAGPRSG